MSYFPKLIAEIFRDFLQDGTPASGVHKPNKADIRAWGGIVEGSLWHVLAASAVGVSHTGDTSETALATVQVPANMMGANGILRVTTLWTITNSGNNKTLRARLGGIAGTAFLGATFTTSASVHDQRLIRNRNAANSQVGFAAINGTGGWGVSSGAVATGAVDTAANQDLVITGQLASAGETITLEAYLVELLHRA
jgi:hypothetical protein